MTDYNLYIFARTIHVLGVVLWIGGVAFVTTVLIPAIKKMDQEEGRLQLFEQLEGRFANQAKLVTLVTGISGFYMMEFAQAWQRYFYVEYWWVHLMTLVWLIFTIVLFVLEPLFLHDWFRKKAIVNSVVAFDWLHRMHKILLSLSLIAVLGAVSGSHGFSY